MSRLPPRSGADGLTVKLEQPSATTRPHSTKMRQVTVARGQSVRQRDLAPAVSGRLPPRPSPPACRTPGKGVLSSWANSDTESSSSSQRNSSSAARPGRPCGCARRARDTARHQLGRPVRRGGRRGPDSRRTWRAAGRAPSGSAAGARAAPTASRGRSPDRRGHRGGAAPRRRAAAHAGGSAASALRQRLMLGRRSSRAAGTRPRRPPAGGCGRASPARRMPAPIAAADRRRRTRDRTRRPATSASSRSVGIDRLELQRRLRESAPPPFS